MGRSDSAQIDVSTINRPSRRTALANLHNTCAVSAGSKYPRLFPMQMSASPGGRPRVNARPEGVCGRMDRCVERSRQKVGVSLQVQGPALVARNALAHAFPAVAMAFELPMLDLNAS